MVPEFPRGVVSDIAMIPIVAVVGVPIRINVPISMVEIVPIQRVPPIIMARSSV
jgi:hypothetical protein